MTSELSKQRNDAITYFTCSRISQCREPFFQNRSLKLFSPSFISIVILGVSLFPGVYFLPLRGQLIDERP